MSKKEGITRRISLFDKKGTEDSDLAFNTNRNDYHFGYDPRLQFDMHGKSIKGRSINEEKESNDQ